MKNVRNLLVIALVASLPLTMSSCLDSGDPGPASGSALASVEGSYVTFFRADDGPKLIPNANSFDPTKLDGIRRVFVSFTFDDETELDTQSAKEPADREYHVTIQYLYNLEDKNNVAMTMRGSSGDSLMTKCRTAINGIDTLYIKNDYLTAFTDYKMTGRVYPALPIFYYADDGVKVGAGNDPDTIDIYMGYNSFKDDLNYTSSTSKDFGWNAPPVYYRAYRVSGIVGSARPNTAKGSVILNLITRQSKISGDTINVNYPVKYPL